MKKLVRIEIYYRPKLGTFLSLKLTSLIAPLPVSVVRPMVSFLVLRVLKRNLFAVMTSVFKGCTQAFACYLYVAAYRECCDP